MRGIAILILGGSLAIGACRQAPAAEIGAGSPPSGRSSSTVDEPRRETSSGVAAALLDGMDKRVPVPLLPMMANHQKQNMRDHLVAVQDIVQGLARNDMPSVERAAKRIGYSEEMKMMCDHMGAGAAGFTEEALQFHHTADGIALAARRGDRKGVMAALGATLQTCTACHATFRQAVVDERTWTRMTTQPVPAGHAR